MEKLRRDSYCEIVATLAEATLLLVTAKVDVDVEDFIQDDILIDEFYDEADKMIWTTRILFNEPAYVLALSPNWDAFWSEYLPEEMDACLDEYEQDTPGGNLIGMMAYYALQADVLCAVKSLLT